MDQPLILGIDPDTKNTGWSVVSRDRIVAVGTVKAADAISMLRNTAMALDVVLKRHEISMAVVESQKLFPGIDPDDITLLSQVAGGLLGQLVLLQPSLKVCFPKPGDWKGQTPKAINQMRTYTHFDVVAAKGKDFAVPQGCARIAAVDGYGRMKNADWKHVGDALGLALYGARLLQSNP